MLNFGGGKGSSVNRPHLFQFRQHDSGSFFVTRNNGDVNQNK